MISKYTDKEAAASTWDDGQVTMRSIWDWCKYGLKGPFPCKAGRVRFSP